MKNVTLHTVILFSLLAFSFCAEKKQAEDTVKTENTEKKEAKTQLDASLFPAEEWDVSSTYISDEQVIKFTNFGLSYYEAKDTFPNHIAIVLTTETSAEEQSTQLVLDVMKELETEVKQFANVQLPLALWKGQELTCHFYSYENNEALFLALKEKKFTKATISDILIEKDPAWEAVFKYLK